jgi:hypothetical protein
MGRGGGHAASRARARGSEGDLPLVTSAAHGYELASFFFYSGKL